MHSEDYVFISVIHDIRQLLPPRWRASPCCWPPSWQAGSRHSSTSGPVVWTVGVQRLPYTVCKGCSVCTVQRLQCTRIAVLQRLRLCVLCAPFKHRLSGLPMSDQVVCSAHCRPPYLTDSDVERRHVSLSDCGQQLLLGLLVLLQGRESHFY